MRSTEKKAKPTKRSLVQKKPANVGIELNTSKFKEMVGRAVKGASFKSILPITAMMAIELKDNCLTLTTTDYTNYLYIREDKIEGDDFYAVVLVDTFAKLISRMTCETIKLIMRSNALEVQGNGKYLIDLQQEDDGSIIRFPNPMDGVEFEPLEDNIHLSTVLSVLNTAKSALATTLEVPCYTGYYCGERIVATDSQKMCGMEIQLWDEPRLIPPQLMNLLAVMTAEDISVDSYEDQLVFSSSDCTIYGRTLEGIEEFDIEAINGALDQEFPSSCKLKKSHIIQLLERLSLFVTSNDDGAVNLHFTKKGLEFSSKAMSGIETIDYVESENFEEFSGIINVQQFLTMIKSLAGDLVELHYGIENAVKLVEGNTILELCLEFEGDEEDDSVPFNEDDEELDDEEVEDDE